MGLYGNFAAYCTIHWCKSFVSTFSCLLCHFGTHFKERSVEKALNLGITGAFFGYIWIDRFDRPPYARVVSILLLVITTWIPWQKFQQSPQSTKAVSSIRRRQNL